MPYYFERHLSNSVCVHVRAPERDREREEGRDWELNRHLEGAVSGVWWGALNLWTNCSKIAEVCTLIKCIVLVKPILHEIGFNQRLSFP